MGYVMETALYMGIMQLAAEILLMHAVGVIKEIVLVMKTVS